MLIVVLDGLELVNPRCCTTLVKGCQLRLQIFVSSVGILYVYCMSFFRRDSTSKRVSIFKYVSIAQLVSIGSIALYLSWFEHSLVAIGNRHSFYSLYEIILRFHALLDLCRALWSRNYDVIRACKSNSIELAFERLPAVQMYGLNSFVLGDASYSRVK